MDEKKRATTFRTSKGTIVNVAAPTVYVSPAFISSEDVTSPTELREELLGNLEAEHGISLTLKGYDDMIGTHFYNMTEFPHHMGYVADVTKARFADGGIYLKTWTYGMSKTLYGAMWVRAKFGDRKGTQRIEFGGPDRLGLILTPTTFRFRALSVVSPGGYYAEKFVDLTWSDDYKTTNQDWKILWYPNLAILYCKTTLLAWIASKLVSCTPLSWLLLSDENQELFCAFTDFTKINNPFKFQPPPLELWSGQSVLVAGSSTPAVPFMPYSSITFYLISNVGGQASIDVDIEEDATWRTLDPGLAGNVVANTLWSYQTSYNAYLGRLTFVPTGPATVSAWAVLRL